ncbi:cyclic pyranopterin monophosphate synthase MoaC [Mollicutes bacterium LVI A0078]|nr:cyclic pyranopterin monophosphate synthase MoaC [Mollicutes bacterium LVI A0075]WOO91575.1 cyclic pyranopterin monophosphate synthase MoaC [Mollicutes bacterium LVI A0078]
MSKFSHFDTNGNAYMVDITDKKMTDRTAVASGEIITNEQVINHIKNNNISKGDVLGVARISGIMAVKNTANIIPMCHPLLISHAKIDFELAEDRIKAICTVKVAESTGVEMEALNGVTTALLTIYDMCKAVDKSMQITNIALDYKSGGKSGTYTREA